MLVILAMVLALDVAPSRADAPWFGYNDNTTLRQQFTPERDAELLAAAGANSMRIDVDWKWVEHSRGSLDLSLYDPIYKAMIDRGIRPLLSVMGSPKWAWRRWTLCFPAAECHVPPDRIYDADWARFVSEVARRYPLAAGIEIWNEPNLALFFHPAPDPQRYTELLRVAYAAVKRVAPGMPVIGGALAPAMAGEGTQVMELRRFLRTMYMSGARGVMDGISVHPYPNGRGQAGVYDAIDATIETRDSARDTVPLWLTEVGASTSGGYSTTAQAIVLSDLVTRLQRRPGVRGVYLHTLADPQEQGFGIEDGFGVLYSSGTPKPAFCAIGRLFGTADCPAPVAGPRTSARWAAQEQLQVAAEAALAWRRVSGAYVGFVSAADPADVHAEPGPGADPTRIAVLAVTGQPTALRLCNTSADTRSYCLTIVPGGPWRFTSLDGTIAETAAATDAGRAHQW